MRITAKMNSQEFVVDVPLIIVVTNLEGSVFFSLWMEQI